MPITLEPVDLGDVQVALTWDSVADLDLHLVEPENGEEIYYLNEHSANGGLLDLGDNDDSNASCGDGPGSENITWPNPAHPAPRDEYTASVVNFDACWLDGNTGHVTNYVVSVNVTGQPLQIFTGSFDTDTSETREITFTY